VLGPEDWILHQAAHTVYKHRKVRLLDLADTDRLVRHFGQDLDWERLVEVGRVDSWLPALGTMLRVPRLTCEPQCQKAC